MLTVTNLKMHFPVRGGVLRREKALLLAVDGVTLSVAEGKTLGIVGESGCGKTTLGKCIVRLYDPTEGRIFFRDTDITKLKQKELTPFRRNIQMIFQDPSESLNSRHSIRKILEEPLIIHGIGDRSQRQKQCESIFEQVGLQRDAIDRFPFEFSGGQRQRIGIARALMLNPELIVCDEPVSALDVSIQSQILNLLLELQERLGIAYVFIAHDLAVVKHISDQIMVMYLGKVMEYGPAQDVSIQPKHPYTRALISAIPNPDPQLRKTKQVLSGDLPSPIDPPSGCPFRTRCPHAEQICADETPQLRNIGSDEKEKHTVACHFDL